MYRYAFVFFLFMVVSCNRDKNTIMANPYAERINRIEKLTSSAQDFSISKGNRLMFADSAKMLIQSIPKDTLYNQLAIEVASSYYMLSNWKLYDDATNVFYQNALKLADSSAIAKAYYNKGIINNRFNAYDSAYYYYYKAYKSYAELNNNYRVGRSYLGMGVIQRKKGDLIGAESSLIKAISFFDIEEDKELIATAYNLLGLIRNTMNDYDMAIEYHLKFLDLKTIETVEAEQSTAYNNLGWDYENKGDFKRAKSLYKKGLALKDLKRVRPIGYGILIDNYAHVRFMLGEINHLPQPYLEALRIADSLGNLNLAISANINLSEYYDQIGDLSNAKKHAMDAYSIGQENIYYSKVPKALKQLKKLSEGEEALKYANKYIQLTDSLQQEERRSRDQFARIRFESDELEAETISLQRKNEKSEARSRLFLSIAIGTVLVGLLLFVIKRQQDSKRKLMVAQRQQKANEEIYQLMLTQQTKLNEGRSMERKRFSKELHDGVLSRLFGVRLSLESMNLNGQNSTKELYVNELQGIEKEIRQISHDLGSDIFEGKQDFVNVVDDLLIRQSSIASWQYELEYDEHINWDAVSSPYKMHMYRIIQEALQNINKYADAKLVHVTLKNDESGITITIKDDGKGFNLWEITRRKGIGLQNMHSRAKEINAKIEIESEKNQGTSITLSGVKMGTATLTDG